MATVSPIPSAVVAVDTGRLSTLRRLYANGIAMALLDPPERVHDAQARGLRRRDESAHRADGDRDGDAGDHGAPVDRHGWEEAAGHAGAADEELGAQRAEQSAAQGD